MKARTLVLILCIGLMCFTGFGSTTADLTDNSTTEMVQSDLEVSVNVVSQVSFDTTVTGDHTLFHEADRALVLEYQVENRYDLQHYNQAKAAPFLRTPDTPIGDVGWQVLKINSPSSAFSSNSLSRNPRDGLRYN